MNGCIFCRIAADEIPSKKVLETDTLLAFHDIRPQAPIHIQIIPRAHIPSLNDLTPAQTALMGEIILAARALAREQGLAEDGWRLVANCGRDAGQEVPHIHFHLLGGRPMGWPPG